jgi:hypothetical protein
MHEPTYPISHIRSVSFQQPEAPPPPQENRDKVVVEAHCVVDPKDLPKKIDRPKLIGGLLALILYRLMIVTIVISLGTYAYNIKAKDLPLQSVYRTTWSLTVVSIILLLVELGVIGFYYTYLLKLGFS